MVPFNMRVVLLVAFVTIYLPLNVASDCSAKPIWLGLADCKIEQAETNTTDSWGIELTIGQPGQTLCLVPSTLLNNTVLMGADVCSDPNRGSDTIDQCRSRRGGLFRATGSFTSTAARSLDDPGWTALNNTLDLAGQTTLLLRTDDSVNMTLAVTTGGQNHATSELGLGIESTFLEALVDAGTIPARAFGIDAGSQSVSNPRDGSVVLGGYDQASIGDHFTEFEMNYPMIHSDAGTRVCPLQVNIRRLVLRPEGGKEILLLEEDFNNYACIEPSVARCVLQHWIIADISKDMITFSASQHWLWSDSTPRRDGQGKPLRLPSCMSQNRDCSIPALSTSTGAFFLR